MKRGRQKLEVKVVLPEVYIMFSILNWTVYIDWPSIQDFQLFGSVHGIHWWTQIFYDSIQPPKVSLSLCEKKGDHLQFKARPNVSFSSRFVVRLLSSPFLSFNKDHLNKLLWCSYINCDTEWTFFFLRCNSFNIARWFK